ncbi:MAG TPA: aminotransferase class I/II-fold pyridoxal phosphate-dependent enzyme [Pirellulales bacterium]|jgi:methionine-gamma-lyase|nr:aminotransferase class I/II-fold pyridoxal phosphate-dependent enzyme [Pirellulales bacterium]
MSPSKFDPAESLASLRHEFGEHGGVNMSIEASTTFTVLQPELLPKLFQGHLGPESGGFYLYGRHYNPTVYVLGRQLAALEGTPAAYCTASGMSAVSAAVLQCCDQGDHVVAADSLYGGTFALFNDFLPRKAGIATTFAPSSDHAAIEAAFTDRTRLLYVESLSNPTLVVADIPRLAEIAHRHGAKLVVDNTFSPMTLSPAQLGADIVLHSLTKFINGASDCIAGAICGDHELIDSMMNLHTGALMLLGPTMDPRIAFEIGMRLPHLPLRVAEHSRRALSFSQRLAERGIPVIYPGLPSHPQHELFSQLANPGYGHGGIFCIDLKTARRANRLLEILQNQEGFGYIAVSLGYFDTLLSCSASSTSSEMSADAQHRAGISPGLIRVSIGYTGSLEQRWEQFDDALQRLRERG